MSEYEIKYLGNDVYRFEKNGKVLPIINYNRYKYDLINSTKEFYAKYGNKSYFKELNDLYHYLNFFFDEKWYNFNYEPSKDFYYEQGLPFSTKEGYVKFYYDEAKYVNDFLTNQKYSYIVRGDRYSDYIDKKFSKDIDDNMSIVMGKERPLLEHARALLNRVKEIKVVSEKSNVPDLLYDFCVTLRNNKMFIEVTNQLTISRIERILGNSRYFAMAREYIDTGMAANQQRKSDIDALKKEKEENDALSRRSLTELAKLMSPELFSNIDLRALLLSDKKSRKLDALIKTKENELQEQMMIYSNISTSYNELLSTLNEYNGIMSEIQCLVNEVINKAEQKEQKSLITKLLEREQLSIPHEEKDYLLELFYENRKEFVKRAYHYAVMSNLKFDEKKLKTMESLEKCAELEIDDFFEYLVKYKFLEKSYGDTNLKQQINETLKMPKDTTFVDMFKKIYTEGKSYAQVLQGSTEFSQAVNGYIKLLNYDIQARRKREERERMMAEARAAIYAEEKAAEEYARWKELQ